VKGDLLSMLRLKYPELCSDPNLRALEYEAGGYDFWIASATACKPMPTLIQRFSQYRPHK